MNYLTKIITIGILPLFFILTVLEWTNLIDLGFFPSDIVHVSNSQKSFDKPQKVRINGKVTKVIPLINSFAYKIQDNTGQIWVVTKNQPPLINQNIEIDGILQYEKILIGEEDFGNVYVLETDKELM